MPLPDAITAAQQYRLALLKRDRAAAARLVRAYGRIWERLQSQVDALAADLDARLANGETLSVAKLGKYDRLRDLQRAISGEVTRYGAVAESEMDALTREAISQAQSDALRLTQASLPGLARVDAVLLGRWQSLPTEAIETLLGFLSDESPLRAALRAKLGETVAEAVGQSLVETLALGVGPRKAATVIRNLAREQLGRGLTWSLSTVRTAHLYAYREASRAAYAANDEIVPRWRWQSARDARTCGACLAMDGKEFPVREAFRTHHQCRCTMVPVVVTYREIGFDVDEAPPVLEHPTGETWFRAQPESTQRAILGPGKLAALRARQFRFADLATPYSDPIYGEMRREATLADLTQPPYATAAA